MITDDLEKLVRLKDAGGLTDDEFERAKAQLLTGVRSTSLSTEPAQAACPQCNVVLVAREEKNTVSAAGLFSAFGFIFGVFVALAAPVVGLAIIIGSLVLGVVGRSKRTFLLCPSCGAEREISA